MSSRKNRKNKIKKINLHGSGNKKTMKKLRCSPTAENKFTCYSNKSLTHMKELWNKRHPDTTIKTNNPREIWEQLREHLSSVCSTEACWLRQKFMENNLTNELRYYTFAPKAPSSWKKDPETWLSSLDIEKVMKQYERKYSCFDFIGPSPIDFDNHTAFNECVWEELCNFDLSKMIKRGKNKIGVVFNTDPHFKDGTHWIALYISLKNSSIYFFDSTGDKPPKEVLAFAERVKKQGSQKNIQFKYLENHPNSHQKKDSECGVYCLYFLIYMIENEDFDLFKGGNIPDDQIQNFRNVYFNI